MPLKKKKPIKSNNVYTCTYKRVHMSMYAYIYVSASICPSRPGLKGYGPAPSKTANVCRDQAIFKTDFCQKLDLSYILLMKDGLDSTPHHTLKSRRCPWCSHYRRRKWTRRYEFKSWTRLIAFHIALIPLGKVWIQLFSLQLWVNSRTDCVLQPWLGN